MRARRRGLSSHPCRKCCRAALSTVASTSLKPRRPPVCDQTPAPSPPFDPRPGSPGAGFAPGDFDFSSIFLLHPLFLGFPTLRLRIPIPELQTLILVTCNHFSVLRLHSNDIQRIT